VCAGTGDGPKQPSKEIPENLSPFFNISQQAKLGVPSDQCTFIACFSKSTLVHYSTEYRVGYVVSVAYPRPCRHDVRPIVSN
jgi:hypothetical protein